MIKETKCKLAYRDRYGLQGMTSGPV